MSKLTASKVRKVIVADSIGRNKAGNLVLRRGFFYRHGGTAENFAARVSQKLTESGISHEVIDKGEHWASFRGGASVANQSHWWVEIGAEKQRDDKGEKS